MQKVDVAGLKIDALTKQQLLDLSLDKIKTGQKTWIVTAYSEFLYHGLKQPELMGMFNRADVTVADGIGIFWAKKYLELPLTAKTSWGKILQAIWQMKYSLAAIIFKRQWILSALKPSPRDGGEKIVGADLVWDLTKMAADNNLSVFLLGGFENTAEQVSYKLKAISYKLRIAGWSNKKPSDATVIDDINKSSTDVLFVAYGPIKQEQWINNNLAKLNIKLAIGVGGSFDYIAGKKLAPPKFIRSIGLEWLWRLITQPYRFGRIMNATFGLCWSCLKYKLKNNS